jgi:hypothetical protein
MELLGPDLRGARLDRPGRSSRGSSPESRPTSASARLGGRGSRRASAADTWVSADVPEARADLLHAIYDRIVVKGRSIVAARLTPAAYANGLALALPQVVRARPEGFEPPTY